MTALAMMIGMLPMSLGLGEGGEQNAPLARAVIGGLFFATVATLFFVPVVFSSAPSAAAAAREPEGEGRSPNRSPSSSPLNSLPRLMHAPTRIVSLPGSFERNGGVLLDEQRAPYVPPASRARCRSRRAPPFRARPARRSFFLILLAVGLVARLSCRASRTVARGRRRLARTRHPHRRRSSRRARTEERRAAGPLRRAAAARPRRRIYARASGYVRRWLVDLGAHVEAGQLLAELETPEIDRAAQRRPRPAQAGRGRASARRRPPPSAGRRCSTASTVSAQEAEEKTGDLSLKQAAVEAATANVQRLQELTGFAKITAPFRRHRHRAQSRCRPARRGRQHARTLPRRADEQAARLRARAAKLRCAPCSEGAEGGDHRARAGRSQVRGQGRPHRRRDRRHLPHAAHRARGGQ